MEAPHFNLEKKKPLKTGSSEHFSSLDFSLTEKEIEKAREELGETEVKKNRKLQEVRDKLAKDKDANYRTDTPYLLRFLRVRKYDSDKAYQNIKESYTFRKTHPEMSQIPDNLEQLLNQNMFLYLPYTDEDGNILFYLDVEKWKCDEISFEEVVQLACSVIDTIAMNPKIQVNGVVGVWDMNGLNTQHIATAVKYYGPRGLCFCAQNMYPWRVKKIVIINVGRLARLLFNMVRPFLSKKISERLILLGSDYMKELHQHVNPALLPKKLGGFLDENQFNVTQNVIDNISYLKHERSFY